MRAKIDAIVAQVDSLAKRVDAYAARRADAKPKQSPKALAQRFMSGSKSREEAITRYKSWIETVEVYDFDEAVVGEIKKLSPSGPGPGILSSSKY